MAELGLKSYRFSVSWPRVQPGGTGAGNPAGPRLLPAAGRRAAGQRHRAVAHPLPLGPAAAAGGRRRLAGPGHRRRASPTTRRWSHDALGDRVQLLDHAQRAVVLGVPRLRLRRARPRPLATAPTRSGPRTTCMLGHGLAVQALRAAAADSRGRRHASTSTRSRRPATRPPTSTPPAGSTGWPTGSSWTRCCAGRYPADLMADLATVTDFGHVRDGDLDDHLHAAGPARRQLLQPARGRRAGPASRAATDWRGAVAAGRAARTSGSSPGASRSPTWAGRSTPRA